MRRWIVYAIVLMTFTMQGFASELSASDPQGVTLSMYDTGSALVSELRSVLFAEGENRVSFRQLPSSLDPMSVWLFSMSSRSELEPLDQQFLYDLGSEESLFARYIGRTVKVESEGRWYEGILQALLPGRDGEVSQRSIVLRSIQDARLEHIREEKVTRVLFPDPEQAVYTEPTLIWRVKSPAEQPMKIRLSYMVDALNWEASYEMILKGNSQNGVFAARVGLSNQTDVDYRNARVKLITTEKSRYSRAREKGVYDRSHAAMRYPLEENRPVSENLISGLVPLETYELPVRVDLPSRSRTQVSLLEVKNIPVQLDYVYDGVIFDRFQRSRRNDWNYGTEYHPLVETYVRFPNTKKSGLGISMPAGTFRLLKHRSDATVDFLGEDTMASLQEGEDALIRLGPANGLRGARERVGYREVTPLHQYEESFEIRLSNDKEEDVAVRVIEHLYRWSDYEVVKSDTPYEETAPQTVEFNPVVKAGTQKTIHYTVRYSW